MAGGHLNVIFHGVFAFVLTEECIEVLVPVFDKQQVCAESGKIKTGLKPNHTYYLSGVCRDKPVKRFSSAETLVLENFRVINRGSNSLFGSIFLPFPSHVYTLRDVPIKDVDFFRGSAARKISAATCPLVHVLTYALENSSKAELGNISLAPAQVNLHISSEPNFLDLAAPGPLECFDSLTRLFPGLDLKMAERATAPSPVTRKNQERVLDDLLGIEQLSYQERQLRGKAPFPAYFSVVIDNT